MEVYTTRQKKKQTKKYYPEEFNICNTWFLMTLFFLVMIIFIKDLVHNYCDPLGIVFGVIVSHFIAWFSFFLGLCSLELVASHVNRLRRSTS